MEDSFILPVSYKNSIHELNTRFVRLGYIYQFHISLEGRTIIFERDEERNYRVIDTTTGGKEIDRAFLQSIVDKLSSL